ncbi:MAG TPA: hypothetical protein VLH10_21265, partial [Yinghuangia sp.]|nr:hypothetical protein [Yinghuangia sp.]
MTRSRLAAALPALALGFVLAAGSQAAPVRPNDPAWPTQRALRQLDLPRVWEVTTGDPSTLVAVVDTGVTAIPDLAGGLAPGYDAVEG